MKETWYVSFTAGIKGAVMRDCARKANEMHPRPGGNSVGAAFTCTTPGKSGGQVISEVLEWYPTDPQCACRQGTAQDGHNTVLAHTRHRCTCKEGDSWHALHTAHVSVADVKPIHTM